MIKKRKIISAVLVLILGSVMIYIAINGRNDAKMVFKVPSNFIALSEVEKEGVFRYVFWETQISFLNTDNTCVYQTNVNNDSFIVKYFGKYYISGSKYQELIEAETATPK